MLTEIAANAKEAAGITGVILYDGIFMAMAGIGVYLFPVLSVFIRSEGRL